MKKLLEFKANISDVKQINPLFSTCKVRVLYTGLNRNMSIITKDAVENALPTLKNIPIVGEFSVEADDFKGHGGQIDLTDFKYIHTTKPYGVVPESATYSWEPVKGSDGSTHEYLTIDGCYLWTGRYEEAYSVVDKGKGQSMEIEVTDGQWDSEEEAYKINSFIFSALCILGDEVEPAFENANITSSYSLLDRETFKREFSTMLNEIKVFEKDQNKEVDNVLKELLKKYSLTVEELTAKGIDFNEISEDELEAKIIEAFDIDVELEGGDNPEDTLEYETNPESDEDLETGLDAEDEPEVDTEDYQVKITELESDLQFANSKLEDMERELKLLREYKIKVEKSKHEAKAKEMFANFQLNDKDVEGIDIHKFSIDQLEEKCYAILGKKLANKKNFTKTDKSIKLPLGGGNDDNDKPQPYGELMDKYLSSDK